MLSYLTLRNIFYVSLQDALIVLRHSGQLSLMCVYTHIV